MKKNKKGILVIVMLLIVGLSTAFVANTYAKYVSAIPGSGSVTVAKWSFDTDNETTTFTTTLDETYDETTLSSGKITAGTSGAFDIELVNTNSEVGVDFNVKLGTITNAPTNLKFYKDSEHTVELSSNSSITGQLAAEDSIGVTVKIYWSWAYETGELTEGIATGDAADTINGTEAKTVSIPVTVKGVQVAPSATTVTSHIN